MEKAIETENLNRKMVKMNKHPFQINEFIWAKAVRHIYGNL